ncbi:hypothetical protein ACJX0J_031363, partial [Zea mays]
MVIWLSRETTIISYYSRFMPLIYSHHLGQVHTFAIEDSDSMGTFRCLDVADILSDPLIDLLGALGCVDRWYGNTQEIAEDNEWIHIESQTKERKKKKKEAH